MTIFVPGWMQGGTYTAQHDRINSRAADWDEGVASRVDLKVSQRGAGANLTVDVAVGACIVQGDDQANQGNYNVFNDAIVNVTGFVATGSNTRYDVVGMQINDPNAGGAAGSNAVLVRIAGTAAASPVIPAIPNSCLPLAIIGPFTTSTTSITNSMIHDAYTATGPAGVTGMRLCQGLRDTPGTTKETYNPIAPNGWLIEAGQSLATATYPRLFEHFGYTFGGGGANFNLPDSRGRVLVALDNQGGSDAGRLAAANALGGTGGEELHTLTTGEMPAHTHAPTDPGHVHGYNDPENGVPILSGTGSGFQTVRDPATSNTASATTGITIATTGGGAAHNVMQPYILAYRIVRT